MIVITEESFSTLIKRNSVEDNDYEEYYKDLK